MSELKWNVPARLQAGESRVAIRPVESLSDLLELVDEDRGYWGMVLTAAAARLGRAPGATWKERLREDTLLQARLFEPASDLRWRSGRGVVLRVLKPGAAADDGETVIGGAGWCRRERCERLWGKALDGSGTWYEERIPAPQTYEGLAPGHRFAFLKVVEYVEGGSVRYVRYVEVEGSDGEGGGAA